MVRPAKIYLDEPVYIKGIEVRHTEEGLKFLIDHYESTMHQKHLTQENRAHRQWLITNWKQHLELYRTVKADL